MLDSITGFENFQLDLLSTLLNFFICVGMSFILRWFYIRNSYSLTGKNHIGGILPILSAVVFVVIVVVKSSLALSLGLVGALSIVRFRTPIKEPEELVYLFMSIAIGLGYAAGQVSVTTIIMLITLSFIYFWLSNRKDICSNEYNLVVNWKDSTVTFDSIVGKITDYSESVHLIRFENRNNDSVAIFLINPKKVFKIDELNLALQDLDNTLNTTFFESNTNW